MTESIIDAKGYPIVAGCIIRKTLTTRSVEFPGRRKVAYNFGGDATTVPDEGEYLPPISVFIDYIVRYKGSCLVADKMGGAPERLCLDENFVGDSFTVVPKFKLDPEDMIYILWEVVAYSPDIFIGAYDTEEYAVAACVPRAPSHGRGNGLVLKVTEITLNNLNSQPRKVLVRSWVESGDEDWVEENR